MQVQRAGIISIVCMLASLHGGAIAHAGAAAAAAPAFEMVTLQGDSVSRESLRGQPTLLIFWAPWCRVCRRDLPEMATFYRHERPEKLRVFSIAFADLRSNVEAFVKTHPDLFVFPTGYDEDRWVARAFSVNATPTYILLDGEGRVVLTHRGGGILRNPAFQSVLSTVTSTIPPDRADRLR